MQPKGSRQVPAETMRVARAAFPKGSLAIRERGEWGPLFTDEEFADLFPVRGKPAWSPGRLALVVVLRFVEGLTDRQAAEAVRARIDVTYALGLELDDPGFDFSVLSEFRDRLVQADGGRRVLDGILIAAREKGLLTTAGRARTDATHVLSSAREPTWLEMVTETQRSALNALARTVPDWPAEVAEPDWSRHYATRAEESRFPKGRAARDEVGLRVGRDGTRLLEAVRAADASLDLGAVADVETLRRIRVQHFRLVAGTVRRRDPQHRPPGATRLVSPCDTEARGGVTRDTMWDGYEVHLTESCEPDAPNLITNVATTVASVHDGVVVADIHDGLAERDCLPDEHWVDAGYPSAGQVVAARREHGVVLHGPVAADTAAGADGPFGQDAFAIDRDHQRVICPNGASSTQWRRRRSQQGLPVIRVRFSPADCRPCPALRDCVSSSAAVRRELTLRQDRDEHEIVRTARVEQGADAWRERYKIRAGVEGTISQAVHRCGLRRSRYRGLPKTSLQHQFTGAAINLARIDVHLAGIPRARTCVSDFARLHTTSPRRPEGRRGEVGRTPN